MTYGPDPRKRPEAKAVVEQFRAKKFEPEAYTLYSLRRRRGPQAGGGGGEVARSEEGRRSASTRA